MNIPYKFQPPSSNIRPPKSQKDKVSIYKAILYIEYAGLTIFSENHALSIYFFASPICQLCLIITPNFSPLSKLL